MTSPDQRSPGPADPAGPAESSSTPTVELRQLTLGDWPAVHDWARLPEASRFQAWGPDTPDRTRAFVADAVEAMAAGSDRLVYAAEVDGRVRGSGELLIHNRTHRTGEIRYIVHPELWGRGVGTVIGRWLLRLAFDDYRLHRVFATCDPRNLGSARVLTKLGMRHEGRLRHTQLLADGWRDSDLYSLLEPEWADRPSDDEARAARQPRGSQ